VCAVVVTYNRMAILRECLDALAAQKRAPERVLVVDNAGTDGSAEMVRREYPDIDLLVLPDNQGTAGGFHEGIRDGLAAGADWCWTMDDDTLPYPDALAELLEAAESHDPLPEPQLLASEVVWTDGSLHPMNQPYFPRGQVERMVDGCEAGLLPLRATSVVSLLVSREAIDRFGPPLKSMFIWGDDIEWTARMLRDVPGYLVPTSVVHHKTATLYSASSSTGPRFYHHVRNHVYMIKGSAWVGSERLSVLGQLVTSTLAYLRFNSFALDSVRVVLRGLADGVRTRPH